MMLISPIPNVGCCCCKRLENRSRFGSCKSRFGSWLVTAWQLGLASCPDRQPQGHVISRVVRGVLNLAQGLYNNHRQPHRQSIIFEQESRVTALSYVIKWRAGFFWMVHGLEFRLSYTAINANTVLSLGQRRSHLPQSMPIPYFLSVNGNFIYRSISKYRTTSGLVAIPFAPANANTVLPISVLYRNTWYSVSVLVSVSCLLVLVSYETFQNVSGLYTRRFPEQQPTGLKFKPWHLPHRYRLPLPVPLMPHLCSVYS